MTFVLIDELPKEIQAELRNNKDLKYVDIWWLNYTNEEGEEYSEIYLSDENTGETLLQGGTWGWTDNLEDALEELKG
ncbi:hypothetical protein SAMN04487895_101603 [Paenibacillus sophorae]|uniref:Uncharacterized protein n=1 Tax=Paenibacillus sophorae TaxID=1333845 RepID=A0A1H8GQ14_9BACL|nr:hypothetical protein [Paenibacillus sophorae]QWU14302.1 hypothetical protein KP014_20560 [Paenibacillus sophorae]SEN46093.1 hypothetical protein SAMN04487895_101603 [Paenibacillus sophorae]